MSTETVLTGEQIDAILASTGNMRWTIATKHERYALFARAIEQAVLQSPEMQQMRKDAERYRSWRTAMVNKNTAWLEAAIDYQAKHFANPEKPTADEFDAGIDAAMEKQP